MKKITNITTKVVNIIFCHQHEKSVIVMKSTALRCHQYHCHRVQSGSSRSHRFESLVILSISILNVSKDFRQVYYIRPCPGISIIGKKGVDFIDVLYSTSMLIPSSSDSFISLWRLVLHQRANTPSSNPVQRSSSFSFSSLISFSLSEYISIERFPNVFRKEDFRG